MLCNLYSHKLIQKVERIMKNKNVKKLLAGLLTVSTVAGAYALGDKLIDFRPVSPDNETKIAGTMQKDEGMSPIPNIFDYLEEKTKETEEVTEETQDTQPEEIHEEEIPSVDVDTPEEKGLTLTGKTNTRNDNLVSGEVCINNSDFELPNDVKRALNKAISDIQNKGLKVGFYLTDIDTNMTISYNGNTDFQPASSVKAGMALYAVKQIEAGQFSFDDKMKYGICEELENS